MIKRILSMLITVCLTTVMTACGESEGEILAGNITPYQDPEGQVVSEQYGKESIIGTWQIKSKNETMTYTFNENGSVYFVNETANIVDSGEYRFENNTLYMTYDGVTDELSVFISNDIMVCYAMKATLERQYYTESDSDANGIYGIWKNQLTEATWFIDRDNTISDLLGTYGFSKCGDIYVAHFLESDNSCPIVFTYENNEITMYTGPVMRRIG